MPRHSLHSRSGASPSDQASARLRPRSHQACALRRSQAARVSSTSRSASGAPRRAATGQQAALERRWSCKRWASRATTPPSHSPEATSACEVRDLLRRPRRCAADVRSCRATILLADAGSCGPSSERCEVSHGCNRHLSVCYVKRGFICNGCCTQSHWRATRIPRHVRQAFAITEPHFRDEATCQVAR
jgi:hypothetical protein